MTENVSEPWKRKKTFLCDNWSVVTTVMKPSPAVTRQAKLGPDWCTVVVLDKKSPANYTLPGLSDEEKSRVTYLTVSAQEAFGRDNNIEMLEHLPWNHFGRKNVGYLFAISEGAKRIWDFDDDNLLTQSTFEIPGLKNNVFTFDDVKTNKFLTFNGYPMMGASHLPIWPRGLPLNHIKSEGSFQFDSMDTQKMSLPDSSIAIIQSLANKDPDVDAIYRLSLPLPVNFQREGRSVAVPDDSYTPLNAQAALFFQPALWMLFLPTSVHGRVSDIWRGYIAQRLAKQINKKVFVTSPLVTQDRNPHSYLADLQSEQDLYFKSDSFLNVLESIKFNSSSIEGCLEEVYIELYNRGFIEEQDILLVQNWILALQSVGYAFPKFNSNEKVPEKQIVSENKTDENCLNWPNLQLFVTLANNFHGEFQHRLLRSLLFFWPLKLLNMVAVLDEESKSETLNEALKQETKDFHSFSIKFNKPTNYYGKRGHNRQQLIMFWADNFTKAELVGFVDTDTFFISPVYQEDLFKDEKPIIIAQHWTLHQSWWGEVAKTTEAVLGEVEVLRCMSVFPVMIKTKHLVELRHFLEQKYNTSFNEYYRSSIVSRLYSQFNIMCNYLWYHHRDEYFWQIQLISRKPVIEAHLLAEEQKVFGSELLYPRPRVSIHTDYHYLQGPRKSPEQFSGLMALGYCYDAKARQLKRKLKWCRKNGVHLKNFNHHMFTFERMDWRYHPKVRESFELRQKLVAMCPPHSWNRSMIRQISLDLADGKNIYLNEKHA